jgi:hypothetical protein
MVGPASAEFGPPARSERCYAEDLQRFGSPWEKRNALDTALFRTQPLLRIAEQCGFSAIPITHSPLKPITHSPAIPISVLP